MPATLTDLPFLVQLRILSHLSQSQLLTCVAPVSRYFYDLTRQPRFWLQLDFTRSNCVFTLEWLRQILDCAPLAQTLLISRSQFASAADASAVAGELLTHCPRLEYLQLAYLNPDADRLIDLVSRPPSHYLRHLDLSGSTNLTPQMVLALSDAFPCLESLCLAHCRCACDATTGSLGGRLPGLKYINLEEDTAPAEAIAELLTSRRDSLCRVVIDASGCESRHLAALAECANVTLLSCDFAEDVDDTFLDAVVSRLSPRLVSLTLRKGLRLSAAAFERLGAYARFPCLVHLDLTECRHLTDSGLCPLLEHSGRGLEILVVNWCWRLTDLTMHALMTCCTGLRSASLVGLHELTGSQLPEAATRLPRLRYLDLRSCNAVQDEACRRLAAQMPGLCIVDFYGSLVEAGGDGGLESAAEAVGFAFAERWTRPVELLRM